MKTHSYSPILVTTLLALAIPLYGAAAQKHDHYKLVDLGTLGGPHSYGSFNGDGFALLNESGLVASYADTSFPDPNAAFGCTVPDCFQVHAAQWKDGAITDLGALPVNQQQRRGLDQRSRLGGGHVAKFCD